MISAHSIEKSFKLYRNPADRLKEVFLRRQTHVVFRALKNISFEVKDGETLGIIGPNGAGKSTLLKILTGVLLPDSGRVELSGRITGLLELGTGFNHEMTGVQNIYLNGILLGMSQAELTAKTRAIIDFAELGNYIDEPIKTYSSGMSMRLAFAIAIHADPSCFVVDEALSVGDAYFQQKCMNRIREFRMNGGSIIFVSHNLAAVKLFCDRAMLLDEGIVIQDGDPESVVNRYNFLLAKRMTNQDQYFQDDRCSGSYGTTEIEIIRASVTGDDSGSDIMSSGEGAVITVALRCNQTAHDVTVGILIRDCFGQDIFGTNTSLMNCEMHLERGNVYETRYHVQMNIGAGKYTVTAAVHTGRNHLNRCYHWCDRIVAFQVAGTKGDLFTGICKLYPSFSFNKSENSDHATSGEIDGQEKVGAPVAMG